MSDAEEEVEFDDVKQEFDDVKQEVEHDDVNDLKPGKPGSRVSSPGSRRSKFVGRD